MVFSFRFIILFLPFVCNLAFAIDAYSSSGRSELSFQNEDTIAEKRGEILSLFDKKEKYESKKNLRRNRKTYK